MLQLKWKLNGFMSRTISVAVAAPGSHPGTLPFGLILKSEVRCANCERQTVWGRGREAGPGRGEEDAGPGLRDPGARSLHGGELGEAGAGAAQWPGSGHGERE